MKLARVLTENKRIGVASQAQARRLISGGRVLVNGKEVTNIDTEVKPEDKVELKGKSNQTEGWIQVIKDINTEE